MGDVENSLLRRASLARPGLARPTLGPSSRRRPAPALAALARGEVGSKTLRASKGTPLIIRNYTVSTLFPVIPQVPTCALVNYNLDIRPPSDTNCKKLPASVQKFGRK